MASTVASSRAACGDLTSTPIDWRRKMTSFVPTPICAASSSTRIFAIGLRLLPNDRLFCRLGLAARFLAGGFRAFDNRFAFRFPLGFLVGGSRIPDLFLGGPSGLEDLFCRRLADARNLPELRRALLEKLGERADSRRDESLGHLRGDPRHVADGQLLQARSHQHPRQRFRDLSLDLGLALDLDLHPDEGGGEPDVLSLLSD